VIDYHTFCQIRLLRDERGLSIRQIARELKLGRKTVRRWIQRQRFEPRQPSPKRPSKLDPFRGRVVHLLHQHPYSVPQLLQRLRAEGYTGSYTILRLFARQVRPHRPPAFLTLHFAPGECAQVDWGNAGFLNVGSTRQRVSLFAMVLCYSRQLYLEFTLGEAMEHWLSCHQNALIYFQGVPAQVMVDNCKVAVLSHPFGQPAVFHPRYADFAAYHGFSPKACAPGQAQQKGRVERSIGYIKQNFLAGLELTNVAALNAAARQWLDVVANVRVHGQTQKRPVDLWTQEQLKLRPLHPYPYDTATTKTVCASKLFRVVFDTNRYSVPVRYAGTSLTLKADSERVRLYHQEHLIAEHVRSYDRHQDIEHPDHVQPLLLQRRQAKEQQLLVRFLALGHSAAEYYQQLETRHLNARHHARQILALAEVYGAELVQQALADALHYRAFSSQYIANLLHQWQHPTPSPGALHLTRPTDLLQLELPDPDLSVYPAPGGEP
jgi:transposase